MNLYHVSVSEDDGWFVGRVLEREGITTQGRTLDELVFMVRDAISLMWDETGMQLELILPGKSPSSSPTKRRPTNPKSARPIPKLRKPVTLKTN
jgi:predicted RNase H-like HicB family nuclease